MTNEHAPEVNADEVLPAIDFTAKAISKRYGFDIQRVRGVLERTEYTGKINDFFSQSTNLMARLWRRMSELTHPSEWRDLHLHSFSPSLPHAFKYLPPVEALNLFENENISLLKNRESAMHYLSKSFTPLYDLKQLRKLTKSLRSHLKRNRDYILETGLPKRTFKKSQLLNNLLSPLYPDKNSYLFSSDESIIYLDESHKLNTKERWKIFNLKLKILKEIIIALRSRNVPILLEKCTDELVCMSRNELYRFIELEKIYFSQYTSTKRKLTSDFHSTTGGIIDILKIIGYYEKELTIGTYSKTKNMLAHIISDRNFTRLRKDNNRDVSPYFMCIALGRKHALDSALDQFLYLQAKEKTFWEQYPHRVQELLSGLIARFIVSDFHAAVDASGAGVYYSYQVDRKCDDVKRVVFETMVETGFAQLLEQNLHHFTEFFKWHIANTGRPPAPPSPQYMVTPTFPDNIFRKEGRIWRIIYQRKSIFLKDSKGLHYIAHLLRHPNEEISVSRLVVEMGDGQIDSAAGSYAKMSKEQLEEYNLRKSDLGHAGEIIDPEAAENYKARRDELYEELSEAERYEDVGRIDKLKYEIEYIEKELSEAFGLGGRVRKAGDTRERARKAILSAIKRAFEKIKEEHPTLWHHLYNSIHTGTTCSYKPEELIPWSF